MGSKKNPFHEIIITPQTNYNRYDNFTSQQLETFYSYIYTVNLRVHT